MSLQGKVALVTGASRGIGQAIALELGRQGAIVVGTATSASGAERIAATLKENGIQGTGPGTQCHQRRVRGGCPGEHSGAVRCAGDSGQ